MQQTKFIKHTAIDELKKEVVRLYESGAPVRVHVKKSRTKHEEHDVTIAGVYGKFFTVKNAQTGLSFTVQFVDMATGYVELEEKKEGE